MNPTQKKYRVVIHNKTEDMLYAHIMFLSEVSVASARKLRDLCYDAFKLLEKIPHRFPVYKTSKTANEYRQLIMEKRYHVIFSINENDVLVEIRYILDTQHHNVF